MGIKRQAGPPCPHGYVRRGRCKECKEAKASAPEPVAPTTAVVSSCIRHSWKGGNTCHRCGVTKDVAPKLPKPEKKPEPIVRAPEDREASQKAVAEWMSEGVTYEW